MTPPAAGRSPRDYESYGLRVRSPIPLPFLRCREDLSAAGEPDVVVRLGAAPAALAGAVDGRRTPSGGARWQAAPGAFLIHRYGVARYLVTEGREILVEPCIGSDAREIGTSLTGTVWSALLLQRGIMPFHASAVEFEAGAVLFLGRSGTGKSSLLGALLKRCHAMLADDLTGVVPDSSLRGASAGAGSRMPPNNAVDGRGRESSPPGASPSRFPAAADARPMALPAYPRLRLCADAVDALDWRGQVREQEWTQPDKYLAPVQRFRASVLPICALYLLDSHDRSGIEIETLRPAAAFDALRRCGWRSRPMLKGLGRGSAYFRVVAAMARLAPVARLARPAAGPLRLDALADRIEAHVRETVPGGA